jgi:hypothetical protein
VPLGLEVGGRLEVLLHSRVAEKATCMQIEKSRPMAATEGADSRTMLLWAHPKELHTAGP